MGTRMRVVVLLLLLLAACSTPQPAQLSAAPTAATSSDDPYPNARRFFLGVAEKDTAGLQSKYSPELVSQLNNCLWLYLRGWLTPAELLNLDDYAAGRGPIAPNTKAAFDKFAQNIETSFAIKDLEPYCPATITALRAKAKAAGS